METPAAAAAAAAAAEMPPPPPAAVSPAARIALLVACMAVVIAAAQFPLLLSYLHGSALARSHAAQTIMSGERGRVLQALAAYSRYKQVATNAIACRRAVYAKLPSAHRSVGLPVLLLLLLLLLLPPLPDSQPCNSRSCGTR